MDNYIQAQTKTFIIGFQDWSVLHLQVQPISAVSPRGSADTGTSSSSNSRRESSATSYSHSSSVAPPAASPSSAQSLTPLDVVQVITLQKVSVSLQFLSLRKLCMLCYLFPVLISTVWLIIFVNTVYIAVFSTQYQSSNSMGTVLQSTFTSPSSETSWVCSISTETSRLLKGVLVHHLVRKQQDDTGWLSLGLC